MCPLGVVGKVESHSRGSEVEAQLFLGGLADTGKTSARTRSQSAAASGVSSINR